MIRYPLFALLGLGLVACGGSSPPPAVASSPPTEATDVEAEVEPVSEEVDAVEEVKAEAEAPPVNEEEPAQPSFELLKMTAAGRPMVQYVDAHGVTTTLGQNGGILKLADATLRIPDGALRDGTNITFELAPKTKAPGEAVGLVYKVAPNVRTRGPRFQIVLPVPAGVSDPSFSVELPSPDEKAARKTKTVWQVVSATKIFTDIEPPLALLELDTLFEGHVTLTKERPKEAAKAKDE